MERPEEQYDIEIELTLYPTDAGGKRSPLRPGYRAGHIALDGDLWIAEFAPKGRDAVYPGETAPVLVVFDFHPEDLSGRLNVGREFFLEEGGRYVGKGTITAMLNFERHVEEYVRWLAERDAGRPKHQPS